MGDRYRLMRRRPPIAVFSSGCVEPARFRTRGRIMTRYRTEKDTLGPVKVPADAYFGAQTQRAVDNFPISGLRLQPAFLRAQAIIKAAAAEANMAAGALDPDTGAAIVEAAAEVRRGEFDDQFVVDLFQAGAGTSQNMNMNEVVANRAEELLGGAKGTYSRVHPNDHVNMSQSTNDTIHAAIHIAAVMELADRFYPAAAVLESALEKKARAFDGIVKCGRTHLQDAVPIRLGQVFGAYASMIGHARGGVERAMESVLALGIGGTAVGTGLNTPPGYQAAVLRHINKLSGHEFVRAPDMIEAMQSLNDVVYLAGALRVMATSLKKIADDFRLLGSGPRTGLGELILPAVQPGSSIMPGKVNPVLAEMLNMVTYQAMGCDAVIVQAAQGGQLELNVMMPVIAYNLLQEIEILSTAMDAFARKCVQGVKADRETCRAYAERSATLATALSPAIGYEHAARLAKEALKKDLLLRDLVKQKNLLNDKELDALLDLKHMTRIDDASHPAAAKRVTRSGGKTPVKRSAKKSGKTAKKGTTAKSGRARSTKRGKKG